MLLHTTPAHEIFERRPTEAVSRAVGHGEQMRAGLTIKQYRDWQFRLHHFTNRGCPCSGFIQSVRLDRAARSSHCKSQL
jgi:hypothetical protein